MSAATEQRRGQLWLTRSCDECGRVFDLFDELDADEWSYGHDCEVGL